MVSNGTDSSFGPGGGSNRAPVTGDTVLAGGGGSPAPEWRALASRAAAEVDRDSPVPLYEQVRAGIERWIHEVAAAEDEIPNEAQLGELFGVSRITVRQALSLLVADGVLYRQRSRGPLHVAPRRVRQQLTRLHGFFTDDVLRAGMDSHTRVLHSGTSHDVRAAGLLGLAPGDDLLRVERLHIGDGSPTALQVSYLPARLYPGLLSFDLSQSLLALIEDRYGRSVTRGVQRLRARPPVPHERDLLRLAPRGFVVEVERVSYDKHGQALEYFSCVLPAERYDFTMDLDANELAHGYHAAPDVFAGRATLPHDHPDAGQSGHRGGRATGVSDLRGQTAAEALPGCRQRPAGTRTGQVGTRPRATGQKGPTP